MTPPLILPLNSTQAQLANVGGKGANLAKLAQWGFPVPGGFLITTAAYRAFVNDHHLQTTIDQTLHGLNGDNPAALQNASAVIRAAFAANNALNDDLTQAINQAYTALGGGAVAVRSSATAEDLPDLSFAGQQDTYLNVVGTEALHKAVVDCWGSLWTARAIGYRTRNAINHDEVALAVVVQQMVPSEASGVMFTANPLNGKRTEMVIDATFGLGEALVSGQVEPDQYVVGGNGRILRKTLGAKALAIVGQVGGGTQTITADAAQQQAIPDEVIVQLVQLGQQVADRYQFPQDIEWGWANGKLHLLQSRPITSLYPLLEKLPVDGPLQMLFSFAAVQGVMEPITPLGQATLKAMMAGLATSFGMPRTAETQHVAYMAGERMWVNITALMRHPTGRRLARGFLRFIDTGVVQGIEALWDDPRLLPQRGWFRPHTYLLIARFFGPIVRNLIRAMRHPDEQRTRVQQEIEVMLIDWAMRIRRTTTLAELLTVYDEITQVSFGALFIAIMPLIMGGMSTLTLLTKLAQGVGLNALALTRGLPHNVTTEMDLELWQTAQTIAADDAARAAFDGADTAVLAQAYLQGELPPVAQTAVAKFMDEYGMRGLGEIDLGRPRWRETPQPVMETLQSYLHISTEQAPDVLFAKGATGADTAVAELVQALRGTRRGWLKARLARFAASRMRALAGMRETPKFLMIRLFGLIRAALLEHGARLAEQGVLARADDVCFLTSAELRRIAEGEMGGWTAVVQERRATNARELKRRQIPRLLLSDGHAFYDGMGAGAEGDLIGSPVSPGVVEGHVRVVLDPNGAKLEPGEILVCPATDPSWTPLFLAAGGLVMEVGGMMTHGSVVAREYGIPAVVSVHEATTRLQTGQRIRVDGSAGTVTILEG